VKHNVFSILHFHTQKQILPGDFLLETAGIPPFPGFTGGSVRPPEKCHFPAVRNFIVAGLVFSLYFSAFYRTQGVIRSNQ
jgi:hypothetical protein